MSTGCNRVVKAKGREGGTTKKNKSGLGRSLNRSKNASRAKQQDALRKAKQTERRSNYSVGGFTSVTEIDSLDDFLANAEMAAAMKPCGCDPSMTSSLGSCGMTPPASTRPGGAGWLALGPRCSSR